MGESFTIAMVAMTEASIMAEAFAIVLDEMSVVSQWLWGLQL